MTFDELEANIGKYLKLEDRGIVKLLCAAVIANRIPALDSTWLFIVSSSSGGKSELLLALSYAFGTVPKDDLTPKTFISGAKGKETSLLFRLPPNAILVVKDLTVLLKKDSRDADAIFAQLRMIYDGTLDKSFGTGEDISVKIRMGLIGGVTGVIEDFQSDDAAVGQRAVKYYMKQPPDIKVDALTKQIIKGGEDKSLRKMIGESFREFLDENKWNTESDLPELPDDIADDISKLAGMATKARSPVKRKKYDRDQRIEYIPPREMPFRMAKQLANITRAFLIMNGGPLTPLDNRILYKLALDSIPSARKEVMMIATKYESFTLDGLSMEMGIPGDSAKIHLDDLIALGLITKQRGYANKFDYRLKSIYRELMAKFENIEMTSGTLDDKEEDEAPPIQEPPPLTGDERQLLEQTGFL